MRGLLYFEKEDCYCSIPELYKKVEEKLTGTIEPQTEWDCKHIFVTPEIADEVFHYYRETDNLSQGAIGALWLTVGPKANLSAGHNHPYAIKVEDGFLSQDKRWFAVHIYDEESNCCQPMKCKALNEQEARIFGEKYIHDWHLKGGKIEKIEEVEAGE